MQVFYILPQLQPFFTKENSKYITQIVSKQIDFEIWVRTSQISVQSTVAKMTPMSRNFEVK